MATGVAPRILHALTVAASQAQAQQEVQLVSSLLGVSDVEWNEILEKGIVSKLFLSVITNRICSLQWIALRPVRRWFVAMLKLARLCARQEGISAIFHEAKKHSEYNQMCSSVITRYEEDHEFNSCVKVMIALTQKLITNNDHVSVFVNCRLHRTMLRLLSGSEMLVVQGTLEVLCTLSDSSQSCRLHLCESTAIDLCLQLLPDADLLTQKFCASLLRILCCEEEARQQLRVYDGIPLLVGLLSVKNTRLKWHATWCLAQLCDDTEACLEVGQLGGVNLLLSDLGNVEPPERSLNDWVAMLAGECALLAQLCQVDSLQVSIVSSNGIYLLGRLLLLQRKHPEVSSAAALVTLQCSAFRVLRLLFSLERNRPAFRKALPPAFLEPFLDIGNFVHLLAAYQELASSYAAYLDTIPIGELDALWEETNQCRKAIGRVGEYELVEQLGAGAFGCVYAARRIESPGQMVALKEIFMIEKAETNGEKSYGDIISEVKIIKQQLRHPNIVRYRRIFVENSRLYIVMDLIDGSSLKDLISSTGERGGKFSEERVWSIFIQMVLALRYLHKEKSIIHRDLKPSNIIINEQNKVVVTDFGLAKQKSSEYLRSTAGTMSYSCPEVVQNFPYGEKADIWALGCCLYEVVALRPAFQSSNMLQLATMIVQGEYEKLPDEYEKELLSAIYSCLTVDPSKRPDILMLSSTIGPKTIVYLDEIVRKQATPPKKVDYMNNNIKLPHSLASSSNSSTGAFSRKNEVTFSEPTLKLTRLLEISQGGPESIDKPRRNTIKALSAGQPPRSTSLSTCFLPRIDKRPQISKPSTSPSRTHSSSRLERRRASKSSEGVSVRSSSLRPIADPVLAILEQIKNVLLITSMNRGDTVNHRRRLIEQFRKRLFSPETSAEEIKMHMRKLNDRSTEKVPLELGFTDYRFVLSDLERDTDEKVPTITYDQVAECISFLLSPVDN